MIPKRQPGILSSAFKAALATLAYAALHSLLASRPAKQTATRIFSERTRNALYRPFYLVQSSVAIIFLIRYIRSLPKRNLYSLAGAPLVVCRLIQTGTILFATWSAVEVGLFEILGIRGLWQFLQGTLRIPPEPEAQGPSLSSEGELKVFGPFRLSRHPLNLAPLILLWVNPRMTANLLAYNIVSTVYLVAGSFHEELRLLAAYGDTYRKYTEGDVPFYLPGS